MLPFQQLRTVPIMPLNIDPSALLAVLIIGGGAVMIVRFAADFARRRVQKRTRDILTSTRTKSRLAGAARERSEPDGSGLGGNESPPSGVA
jgi:hypothetical protein